MMKISELWLREWVMVPCTASELATKLTMAGLEVDSVTPVAKPFTRVVVAKVLRTAPHPEADRLTLCEVDAGTLQPLKIVCGAANVRTGLYVALALTGAELPGGILIKESKLRGQLSQGMLCSATELGLDDASEGILEFPDDAPIGRDVREYLSLDDVVFDVDLTPNRADCFSVVGVAREVAALYQLPAPVLPMEVVQPNTDDSRTVYLNALNACPAYYGRVMRGINPEAMTPTWMKERLRRSGIRPIHPVVDVTQYVMLELGQPMHAFDLSLLSGFLEVRFARPDEDLLLLNGQNVVLQDSVLVIADQEKPLALAGIMGGEVGSVTSQTTDIFLESAFFNPLAIAGVARRFGLSTDASQRFERGVDPLLPRIALERATALLQSIVGGEVGPITGTRLDDAMPPHVTILFNPQSVRRLTGLSVSENTMVSLLKALGMEVVCQDDLWKVDVPSHRFDLTIEADLVEEIIRLYGYDKLPSQPLVAPVVAGRTSRYETLGMRIAEALRHRGYHESISYSFVDPELQEALYPEADVMMLVNPLSRELSTMRLGLWPGLLASMVYNSNRQQTAIKLFESGVVFEGQGDALRERPCIAGLLTGEHGNFRWNEETRLFDFYDMKGDVQSLLASMHLGDVRFEQDTHKALHPGQSARIFVGANAIGWLGVLHPSITDALDLTSDVMLFELDLSLIPDVCAVRYQKISKYPYIRRDLSLLVDETVSAGQIETIVREVVAKEWLKLFEVFDVYMGEAIPTGKKSLAIALILQDDDRTLIDAEINSIISAILEKLYDEFSIVLRD